MGKKKEISPRQEEILFFIQDYYKKNGYPPTVREIGEGVGLLSSCTVHYHLEKLEEKGIIRKSPSKARAIEICLPSEEEDLVAVPFLNGFYREPVYLPRRLLGEGNFFLWQVENNGWRSWHILEGDLLLVRKEREMQEEGLVLIVRSGREEIWEVGGNLSGSVDNGGVVGKIVGVWRRL